MATQDEVIAEAQKFARNNRSLSEYEQGMLLTDAWWQWNRATDQHLAAFCYVWMAFRRLRNKEGTRKDVWLKLVKWEGGDMNEVLDQSPNAERCLEEREWFTAFLDELTEMERKLVLAMQDGISDTKSLAEYLNVTPGRVSQLRRQIFEKAKFCR